MNAMARLIARRQQRFAAKKAGGVVPSIAAASEPVIEPNSVLEFDEPIVVVRSGLAAPALSGVGADGGRLVKNGDPIELDITFNCLRQKPGTEAITIKIPILSGLPVPAATALAVGTTADGDDAASAAAATAAAGTRMIQFTLTKVCNGVPHLQGTFVTGLKIASEPHLLDTGADVVLNGFTRPSYASHKLNSRSDPRRQVPREEDVSPLFVRYKNRYAETLRAYEPVVVARPPICNPMIEHSFA